MSAQRSWTHMLSLGAGTTIIGICGLAWNSMMPVPRPDRVASTNTAGPLHRALTLEPITQETLDTSGYRFVSQNMPKWPSKATLGEIGETWNLAAPLLIADLKRDWADQSLSGDQRMQTSFDLASCLNYESQPAQAYEVLSSARSFAEGSTSLRAFWLPSLVYFQGISALRRGETDNCVMCRGECSCILPIARSAVHTNSAGSRLAIEHFTEYLNWFPVDLEVQWLLNVAHMTLGEYPNGVDPKYLIPLDFEAHPQSDIGRFRDIGKVVGVNRFNQAGGAIMDDFDNDGLLDIVVTSWDPSASMAVYHNQGDGTFAERIQEAGVENQLGGLVCTQTDYDNDGWLDIFIPRGAWTAIPMPASLLHNGRNGRFTDVTKAAGLDLPANSNSAPWADYDNDGWLDLFLCCERQPNRLYHNQHDGTFKEVAEEAGLSSVPDMRRATPYADGLAAQAANVSSMCKGATWIDYDNDSYPDLFVNALSSPAKLYHNQRDGTFRDVSAELGIDGPNLGFSCWTWDFDNDGWQDIFATCYDHPLRGVVLGLEGKPHQAQSNRLFRNVQGKRFENVTREAGLDLVLSTMGSNFADLDNDGWLDMYLGTGDPDLSMLVPNRMFRSIEGKKFVDISFPSGTAHLQKGHGIACGDWDRDGNTDIFVEMGGATNGDKFHNILFQNPGSKNHQLTVKLVGKTTNRAAIGVRIKAVTASPNPRTIYRHVSSGSSFGGNPLEQSLGLGDAERVDVLEVFWPTSQSTQRFRDLATDQRIQIMEFEEEYRTLATHTITVSP